MKMDKYFPIRKGELWKVIKNRMCLRCFPMGISCVYIFMNAGCIVYVGTTSCIVTRMRSHKRIDIMHKIYYVHIKNTKERLRLESDLINYLKPKLNIRGFLKEALISDLAAL